MSSERAESTPAGGRVLIVDDEASARHALAKLLTQDGHQTATAGDGEEALRQLEEFDPDVILTDLRMPKIGGIELIRRGRALSPSATFIVMTAFGSIDTAIEAIKLGAESYLTKPLDVDAVSALTARGVERAMTAREASRLRDEVRERYAFDRIIGSHPTMQRLMKQVAQVASVRTTVLLEGETGTGKELIAAAIHQNSKRANRPFVRLNCAALAENLLESELFGHERGAFTGAATQRQGRFEQADGGTLFLDEISEVSPAVQVKLLRFLQEREFERVGGNETISVDVRVVAATNRRLKDAVASGTFREDLYYRLNVVTLEIPPLRARRTDIPLLARYFLARFAEANERDLKGFTPEAMQRLSAYSWPGNVRELENTIERAVVFAEGEYVDASVLPGTPDEIGGTDLSVLVPGITLAELERIAIERTLEAVGGSTAKAAELLGISQRKVQYRVKEWGLGEAQPSSNGSPP